MTGARYQIVVDGQPRSNRDDKAIAIEAAEYLKYKHPHAAILNVNRCSLWAALGGAGATY